ncbi:MAG TPA: nitric oxide synthase oxygenase [Nakamurella sp.]
MHTAGSTEAAEFQGLLLREGIVDRAAHGRRLREINSEFAASGRYEQTVAELEHACRVAWRANPRCIGRLPWQTLRVLDRRHLQTPDAIFEACVEHLRLATNGGRIRPVMTVFAPANGRAPRIWNSQLVRYAGWRRSDGTVLGDPAQLEITERMHELGWRPERRTAFTVLPVVIQVGHHRSRLFELPSDAVLEVPIAHPEYDWFAELGLRWYAVPMVSNLALNAGGVHYSAAPFNGWYMSTEIAARNLADVDRYDMLPVIARWMGLKTRSSTSLWRDRALVELNVAVLHSFKAAGVRMVDHHSASEQFMTHVERERGHSRDTPGDWSWLVPPLSGATTPVFHRYYADEADPGTPLFEAQPDPWRATAPVSAAGAGGCPVHRVA